MTSPNKSSTSPNKRGSNSHKLNWAASYIENETTAWTPTNWIEELHKKQLRGVSKLLRKIAKEI